MESIFKIFQNAEENKKLVYVRDALHVVKLHYRFCKVYILISLLFVFLDVVDISLEKASSCRDCSLMCCPVQLDYWKTTI